MSMQLQHVVCDTCQTTNVILPQLWNKECHMCRAIVVAPPLAGSRYTEVNCSGSPVVYSIPENQIDFACACCGKFHRIGNTVARQLCGQIIFESQLLSKVIENLEKRNSDLKHLLEEAEEDAEEKEDALDALRAENEKLKTQGGAVETEEEKQQRNLILLAKESQIQFLQQEMQIMKSLVPRLPEVGQCDLCGTQASFGYHTWGAVCSNPMCRNLILAKATNEYRYAVTSCKPLDQFHRKARNTIQFRCECCAKAYIIESTIAMVKCGQPVYATRLADDKESNQRTEENGPRCPEGVEERLSSLCTDLKKQNAFQQQEIDNLRTSMAKVAGENKNVADKVTKEVMAKVQLDMEGLFHDFKSHLVHYNRQLDRAVQAVIDKDEELAKEEKEKASLKNELNIMRVWNDNLQKLNVMAMKKIGSLNGQEGKNNEEVAIKKNEEQNDKEEEAENEKKEEEENLVDELKDKIKNFLGF